MAATIHEAVQALRDRLRGQPAILSVDPYDGTIRILVKAKCYPSALYNPRITRFMGFNLRIKHLT